MHLIRVVWGIWKIIPLDWEMAWFSGKVSLGNFPDLAGAVNKLSESVKNIEKNFDSALGFEDKAGGGPSSTSSTEGT